MTPEQEELLTNPSWYDGRKRSWSPQDLSRAYNLYNRITGEDKKDVGCGSCRRSVVQFLQDKYRQALPLKEK